MNKISKATLATTYLTCYVGSIKKIEKENGKNIVFLRVATHRKPKDSDEVTDWHNVVSYDRLAEVIHKYVEKGQKIVIEGEMEIWDDKDENGKNIKRNYIKANSIKFKSEANISLMGFVSSFYREDEESPLYIKLMTTRKVYKENEKTDRHDYHKVAIFGNLADEVEKFIKKDIKMMIVGNIETEKVSEKEERSYIRARRAKIL